MIFERADSSFGRIAAVNIRGKELVCTVPLFSDDVALLLGDLVFQDLVGYFVAPLLEAGHDGIVDTDEMEIMLGGKWGN